MTKYTEINQIEEALALLESKDADIARLTAAANQARLAFAGYVSPRSAIDLLDDVLGDL